MNPTAETREHAQHVLNYITAFPSKHDQDAWFYLAGPSSVVTEDNFCGTTMCAAGTSVFLKEGIDSLKTATDFEGKAGENLGLDEHEAAALFYTMNEDKAKAMLAAVAAGDKREFDRIYEDEDGEYEEE